MAIGTQMVKKKKKNKLNNSSKWFTFGQKLDRSFQATVFYILKRLFVKTCC